MMETGSGKAPSSISAAAGAAGGAQRPLNCGGRRSASACVPSRKSSLVAHSSCAATSCSSVAASAGRAGGVEMPFARPTASGAQASSSPTSSVGRGVELVGRRDAVDEPDPLGLGAVDELRGHDELLRAAEADERRQPRAAADVGDQADPRLDEADDRVGGHDAQVAGQRELGGAAEAGAVDLGDRRLGHVLAEVPDREDRGAPLAQPRGVGGERAEVGGVHAAGEHRARAAQHDEADGRRRRRPRAAPRRAPR